MGRYPRRTDSASMIRHVSTHREDRVVDAIGCVRVFGSVFVCTGSFALWAALGGGGGLDEAGAGPRLLLALIGASHLGAGLFLCASRWSRAVVRRRGVEWTERGGLRPARSRFFVPSDIGSVFVEEMVDSDGDSTYRVVLRLGSGETVPLTHQFSPSEETAADAAAAVARRLQIPERVG